MSHKFPLSITGEFITLRKVTVNDSAFIYELRTSTCAQYLNQPPDYSINLQREWIEKRTDAEINYIILRNDTMSRAGMVAILDVNHIDLVSSVGRLLLCEQYVNSSTPYGIEALKITYGYVFNEMQFRKISGVINSRNKKVYDLQKYLGMIDEGYFKKHTILRGELQDMYFLSLFSEQYPAYKDKIDTILDKFR